MPVTQTDVPARSTSLAPPVGASAIVATPQPRKEAAPKADAVREPFDFNEYIEFLQYAEWGWF